MKAVLRAVLAPLFSVTLIYFAILQLNDPDPHLWITAYLIPVVVMLYGYFFKHGSSKPVLNLAIVVYFLCTLAYLFIERDAMLQHSHPDHIEVLRELGGLVIIFIFLILVRLVTRDTISGPDNHKK